MSSENAPRDDCSTAAARLRCERQRVLARWAERVRAHVPEARRHESLTLFDHMMPFVDELIEVLEGHAPCDELERRAAAPSAEHGKERANLTNYSLDEVVQDYQWLQEVLLEVLDDGAHAGHTARNLVLNAIQVGVRNAASEFVRLREREREGARDALRRANTDLERQVRERTQDLLQTEARFRAMVEAVEDYAIFTVDPEGFITSWNSGAQRMKGYSAEEAIGQHFSMLYPAEGRRRDEPMSHLRVAAAQGRFRGEGIRLRKNGNEFMADVSITSIHEDGRLIGFAKVVQDLTERNLLMQERDLTRSDAETLKVETEYRKRFVATMTHDLRSPLSAAKAAAHMIARSPQDEARVRTWAVRISDIVDRSDRMISDLLDASQLEAGERLPLKFESVDLAAIATDVCNELSTRYGDRFKVETQGSTLGIWSGAGLRRVLDNLISNAIKYGDALAPITTRVVRVDDHVLLSVHNEGTIIPADEQQQLFQPFHRTRLAQASDKRGWGLGLTLVKGLVEAHGGIVKVESYPRYGTTFTVDLPVQAPATMPHP